MEQESVLQLNPYTYIDLKHPILRDKVRKLKNSCKDFLKTRNTNVFRDKIIQSIQCEDEVKQGFIKTLTLTDFQNDLTAAEHIYELITQRSETAKSNFNRRIQNKQQFMVAYLANRYVLQTTAIKEIPCTCNNDDEISLMRLLPVGMNSEKVICYNSCQRTLFAAFKRQMMKVYQPSEHIANKQDNGDFQEFVKQYFHKYVEPVLSRFDYSYSQWYNKMPRNKQMAMDLAQKEIEQKGYPDTVDYGLFCKREKQIAGGKNRAIANIDPTIKYIMGPVCWALEDLADKFFPGYCGKKSWEDLEDLLCVMHADGFDQVLQGDGSAFDTCQHYELKLIDRLIYNYLADNGKIWHVDPQEFKRIATAELRNLKAKTTEGGKFISFANAVIRGTVFSGASDTTLMNTLRMALYNMYTLERKGMRYGIDYKLLAKGDDFMVFVKGPTWEGQSYQEIYDEIWKKKPKHTTDNFDHNGDNCLGMILKFLVKGLYETIDFCSVTCIPYDDYTKFKLARKPDRMTPLAHYSRNALRMTKGQYKQYLIDQALAIELAMPEMPFYQQYAQAYRYHASLIKAEPERYKTGRARKILPNDGHRHIERNHIEQLAENEFYDYGHEFVEGLKWRQSRHKVPASDVYAHLQQHFHISYNDIAFHGDFLRTGGLYDAVADSTSSAK